MKRGHEFISTLLFILAISFLFSNMDSSNKITGMTINENKCQNKELFEIKSAISSSLENAKNQCKIEIENSFINSCEKNIIEEELISEWNKQSNKFLVSCAQRAICSCI
jgi:hypothetical protein